MTDNGYVYVLMNPSMQNLVKIGKTKREPEERAKELSSTTGVPTPFIVVYDCYFEDCTKAENYVHALLENKGFRISPNREFFEIPMKDAIDSVMKAKEHFGQFEKSNFNANISFNDNIEEDYDPDLDNIEILQILMKAREYENGLGEELQDIDEAINYYLKAIKLGSIEAYFELGCIYEEKEDNKRAMKYFKEGSTKGCFNCYANMAILFEEENSINNAFKCWKKYFTYSKHIIYIDAAIYLKHCALHEKEMEYLDKIKPIKEDVINFLENGNDFLKEGEFYKFSPEFYKHVKTILNNDEEEQPVTNFSIGKLLLTIIILSWIYDFFK